MEGKVFIVVHINKGNIFIKVDPLLMEEIHDMFYDAGYNIQKSNGTIWESYIDAGLSYEIDTLDELVEFKNNNINIK